MVIIAHIQRIEYCAGSTIWVQGDHTPVCGDRRSQGHLFASGAMAFSPVRAQKNPRSIDRGLWLVCARRRLFRIRSQPRAHAVFLNLESDTGSLPDPLDFPPEQVDYDLRRDVVSLDDHPHERGFFSLFAGCPEPARTPLKEIGGVEHRKRHHPHVHHV